MHSNLSNRFYETRYAKPESENMSKYSRRLRKFVEDGCREIGARLIEIRPHKGHYRIEIIANGETVKLTASGSPKNEDHALRNVRDDIIRYAGK